MQLPTQNPITLPYGSTEAPYSPATPHRGTDYGWRTADGREDKTIYAVEDCTLVYKANNGNDGNGLYAQVGNRTWGYLHLERPLKTGAVRAGEAIGIMGQTGAADGIHLHLAFKLNGVFADGDKYIKEHSMATDAMTPEEVKVGYRLVTLGQDAPPDHVKFWTGKGLGEYLRYLESDPSIQGVQQRYKDALANPGSDPKLSALGQAIKEYVKE